MDNAARQDRDGGVIIHIEPDEMSVLLDLFPPQGSGRPIDLETVENRLLTAGVATGLDRDAILEGLRTAEESGDIVKGVAAARGTPAVDTRPRTYRYPFETAPVMGGDNLRIDFRAVTHYFVVHKGDLLAEEVPRVEGSKGVTVTGRELPFTNAADEELACGGNVEARGGSYYSLVDGRVVRGKGPLAVEPALLIEKDVDYSTGNVHFPGDVVVGGGVKDDFIVEADGNLVVRGRVEGARISARKSVEILGGFSGKGRGEIRSAESIRVAYVDNGRILCLKDLAVGSEIVNSYVRCNGKVSCLGKKGAIIGGKVAAHAGIECVTAGSSRASHTVLKAGVDVIAESRLERADELVRKLQDRITYIIQYTHDLEKSVIPAMVERRGVLAKEKALLVKKLNELTVERGKASDAVNAPSADVGVKVRNKVYPGVRVVVSGVERDVTEELPGTLFRLDPASRQVILEKAAGGAAAGAAKGAALPTASSPARR